MTERPDVLVIGAGCIGVCSAYFLAERGAQVTLVDQGEICAGCSYGNAGQLSPSHSVPLAAPGVIWQALRWMPNPESPFYVRPRLSRDLATWMWRFRAACTAGHVDRAMPVLRDLSLKSIALFSTFADMTDMDFLYENKGVLKLFRTEQGRRGGLHEAALLEKTGTETELMDGPTVRDRLNGLETTAVGGIYYPTDAHIIPSDFVHALARKCASMGVQVHTSTKVLGFEKEGRRITGVQTSAGVLRTDELVLAAGSWSPGIARDLRLNLPIQPAKGYSLTYDKPNGSPPLPLLFSEARVFMTPMGSKLRVGGTLELAGMDLSINQRRVDAIARATTRYLPGLNVAALQPPEVWAGLRPATPDGVPLLGRSPAYSNLIIAAGHAMMGMSTGPASGLLVAQIIAGETPFIPTALLDPARYG